MQNESPHFGLDIDILKTATPAEISRHIVLFSREARNDSFVERVNPIAIPLKEFAKLVKPESNLSTDIATNRIYGWAINDIPTKRTIRMWLDSLNPTMEEILSLMPPLKEDSPDSVIIWISPKGKVYKEVRINVYQTIIINGEKYLFFWGIPSNHSDEKCLEFAQNLTGFKYKDAEDLRINPVAVKFSETLESLLQRNIELPEVWEAIADGSIIEKTVKELRQGQEIVPEEVYQRMMAAETYWEKVRIGKEIELATRAKFQIELLDNAHGGLYSNISTNQLMGFSILQLGQERFLLTNSEISSKKTHCGKCKKYGPFLPGETCPDDKSFRN